jgi:glycosyltransferase involved in cell wall biosynthesis
MMDLNRVIYGVHNVHTPKGASNEHWMRLYQSYAFGVMKRFHVFSRNQLGVISDMLPTKRLYYAPFAPDDYGESTAQPPRDRIRFTSFGYIRQYKRLDLLIGAFKTLYDEGLPIELLIAGGCDRWDRYATLIGNHPGIHAKIGVIPNEDIPDLISSSHYLVLPYQDGAQSAVLPLAYRYGTPVITSDIDAFRDAVVDGTTGFRFRSLSQESLCQTMWDVVLRHEEVYAGLQRNIRAHVAQEYSLEGIFQKYRDFIDDTLQAGTSRDVPLPQPIS